MPFFDPLGPYGRDRDHRLLNRLDAITQDAHDEKPQCLTHTHSTKQCQLADRPVRGRR